MCMSWDMVKIIVLLELKACTIFKWRFGYLCSIRGIDMKMCAEEYFLFNLDQ